MVKTGLERRSSSGYIPELDGLRAIAILLVVVFHCRTVAQAATGGQRAYVRLAEAGWIGVDLFFVLSGFLITGILLDTVGRAGYFRSFYVRRVLRIFPLYYAALAAYAVGAHVLDIERLAPPSIGAEVAHWFYIQNWLPLFGVEWTRPLAHFWSLGVEEQFYLFWPALVLVFARRGRVAQLCLGTIAISIAARIMFSWAGESDSGSFTTVAKLDTLAIGGYLACVTRGAPSPWLKRPGLMAALAAALAVAAGVAIAGGSFFRPTNMHIFTVGLLPLAVFFGATLGLTLIGSQTSPWRRLLRTRPMTAIGRVSYGVYVFHWPLVLAIQPVYRHVPGGFWIQQAAFLATVLAGSLALAALSYTLFERRFLNLKDRLAARPGPPPDHHASHALDQKAQ